MQYKQFITQKELDKRLMNLFLLQKNKEIKGTPRISLQGQSNMFVGISGKNYFPVYIIFGNSWFFLGLYSSEELETNPELDLNFPETTYLTFQDLETIYKQVLKLKDQYGNVSTELTKEYRKRTPKGYCLTFDSIKEIFRTCSLVVQRTQSKNVERSMNNFQNDIRNQMPKEVKHEPEFDLPLNFEPEKPSRKQIEEELEDLDVQMRLLNLEKQQIVLQQKINKLKRA